MSKHTSNVLACLQKDIIMSTNEILQKLEEKTGKSINWHALYRILMDLYGEGKIERLSAKAGFFWS